MFRIRPQLTSTGHRVLTATLLIVLATAMPACQRAAQSGVSMPAPTGATVDGIWEQAGYGKVLEVDGENVRVYDVCEIACALASQEKLGDLGQVVEHDDKAMSIRHGIKDYHYTKLQELPPRCRAEDLAANDALHNFDVLWRTFDEHYCCFERRGVDWSAQRELHRKRLTRDSTPTELYSVLIEMLDTFGDGHIQLDAPEDVVAAHEQSQAKDVPEDNCPFPVSRELQQRIADSYLETGHSYNRGIVRWGMARPDVAYVQVNLMLLLADYEIPAGSDIMEFAGQYFEIAESVVYQRQDEIDGARAIMGTIVSSLPDARAYILDVRFNGGGKDGAALEIMNHFTAQRTQVGTIKARQGSGYTDQHPFFVTPSAKTFAGDVYVLTSPLTASAAELVPMAAKVLPNVTQIGSSSEGIFSSTLDKTLPNGWEYTLSNEVYEDLDGHSAEGVGIAPRHTLDYSRNPRLFCERLLAQLEDGDDAIELALALHARQLEDSQLRSALNP